MDTTQKNTAARKPKLPKGSFGRTLLVNIGAMILLGALLVWGVFMWLGSYTRHNDVVLVPDVMGLTADEATSLLHQHDLLLSVNDSIYNPKATPGTIVECVPKIGASIKHGRTVFVVINAVNVPKRTLPQIGEISMRQALAILRAAGFTQVTVKYVGGVYNDLALGLFSSNGTPIAAGEKIPYNTQLILQVSSNDPSYFMPNDSTSTEGDQLPLDDLNLENSEDEDWF